MKNLRILCKINKTKAEQESVFKLPSKNKQITKSLQIYQETYLILCNFILNLSFIKIRFFCQLDRFKYQFLFFFQ